MLEKFSTKAGLNFAMESDLYQQLIEKNQLHKAEKFIETSELSNVFLGLVFFIVASFSTKNLWIINLSPVIGYIVGGLLSLCLSLVKWDLYIALIRLFRFLREHFITALFIILFSIFYLHYWWVAIIYFVINYICNMIYTLMTGYVKKAGFHNKIALYLITNN